MRAYEVLKKFNSNPDAVNNFNKTGTFGMRNELYQEILRRNGLFDKNMKILDVACGKGMLIRDWPYKVKHGIDLVGHEEFTKNNPNSVLFECDLNEGLPSSVLRNRYDIVFLMDIIEHLFSIDALMEDVSKILKKNGRIFVTLGNDGFYVNRIKMLLFGTYIDQEDTYQQAHLRFFTVKQFAASLTKRGFDVAELGGYNLARFDNRWSLLNFIPFRKFLSRRFPGFFATNLYILARKRK
ncbi:MAG: class I SAM-dependent methyltransferase [Candidatus Woesearchaeota archaeon]